MRSYDQIQTDYKAAVDAKLRIYERAAVVTFSVAIIGIAVLFCLFQAVNRADEAFHQESLINQEARI